MRSTTFFGGLLLAGGALVAGALSAPAWAAPPVGPDVPDTVQVFPDEAGGGAAAEAAAACSLGADNPKGYGGNKVKGTGSRSGCGSSKVTLTVLVKKDITAWPDTTIGENKKSNFGNGSLTARGTCDGKGDYYTETRSSTGNKLQSARRNLCG